MAMPPKRQKRLHQQRNKTGEAQRGTVAHRRTRQRPKKRGSLKGRLKKRLGQSLFFIAVLAIIGLTAYDFFYLWLQRDSNEGGLGIVAELAQFSPGDNPAIHTDGGWVYVLTGTTLSLFDVETFQGAPLWQMAHGLSQPRLSGQEAYVVVWQPGVTPIRVVGPEGTRYMAQTPRLLALSPGGQVAVLSSVDTGDQLQVFDAQGQLMLAQLFEAGAAIPMVVALNETHVAVGFMHIHGVAVSYSVAVFDFELGLVASTGEQQGLVHGIELSPTHMVVQTTQGDFVLDLAQGLGLEPVVADPRPIVDRLGTVVLVQEAGRQFTAYDEGESEIPPMLLWRFLSLPEPEQLLFAGQVDRLVLKTNQRLYLVARSVG